jgi:hypothetical protein
VTVNRRPPAALSREIGQVLPSGLTSAAIGQQLDRRQSLSKFHPERAVMGVPYLDEQPRSLGFQQIRQKRHLVACHFYRLVRC